MKKFIKALSAIVVDTIPNTPYIEVVYPHTYNDMAIKQDIIMANILAGTNATVLQIKASDSELLRLALVHIEYDETEMTDPQK